MSYTEPAKKYRYDDPIALWFLEEYEKIPVSGRHEVTLKVPIQWLVGVIKADRRRKAKEDLAWLDAKVKESEDNGGWPPVTQTMRAKLLSEAE